MYQGLGGTGLLSGLQWSLPLVIAIKYNLFHFKFGGHFEYLIISNLEFRKTFSNLRLLNEHSNK